MTPLAELPSLYAALGPLPSPALDLHARQLSSSDRSTLNHLVQTCERRAAATFLRSVLEQSHAQTIQAWKRQPAAPSAEALDRNHDSQNDNGHDQDHHDDEDDDALELRERGYVHKRKRARGNRHRSTSVASAEGDDEGGSDTEAAAVAARATRSHRDKVRSTRRRVKRLRETLRIPHVELEEPDLPPDFPSSDLFAAVHAHASQVYEARHHLLPPLTPAAPLLAPSARSHFDAVAARVNQAEEHAVRTGTREVAAAWRRTRILKANAGERRGIWTDANRAFEGSALVALGLLTRLLVEDAVTSEAEQLPDPPAPLPSA
ncbi:hypothetical protein JCM3774_004072 [Rhodotorula dairenensis]